MRHSDVTYIAIGIRINSSPHFLLLRHKKWADWSLVGGHVEPFEGGHWAAAAVRETQEELPPLQHRREFLLVPIFSTPVVWGPEISRSAGNRETMYQAQFFAMEFLEDPPSIFSKLASDDLRLVPQVELEHWYELATPIRILSQRLRGGLTSIPLAWSESVSKTALPPRLFEPISARHEQKAETLA